MHVDFIVDRLHVSTSNIGVIRAIRKRMIKAVRKSRAQRDARHYVYRAGLKRHAENKGLYHAVMTGRF